MLNIENISKNPNGGTDIIAVSPDEKIYLLHDTGKELTAKSTPVGKSPVELSKQETYKLLGFMCGISYSDNIAKGQNETLSNLTRAIISARIKAKQEVLGMKII